MEKRALLAIALSFLIFVGFDKAIRWMYPTTNQISTEQITQNQSPTKRSYTPTTIGIPESTPTNIEDVTHETFYDLETEKYFLKISNSTGALTSVQMKAFTDPKTQGAFHFIDSNTGRLGVGAVEAWLNEARISDWKHTISLQFDGYTFTKENEQLKITQNFKTHNDGYGNDYNLIFENKSTNKLKLQYQVSAGSGVIALNTIDKQYIEANWIQGEKIKHVKEFKAGKIKKSEESYPIVSVKSRHFSSIFKSFGTSAYYPHVEGLDANNMLSVMSANIELLPSETATKNFLVYLGPNRVSDLEPYELGMVVNFGKMDSICKLLIGGMQAIEHLVKNFGVAIILLTIVTNVILSPLTKASFMSMQRMQLVQPQVSKLREKFKSEPAKLNQETMALYKKHKINPMGGCLPMIVQMPIFISLYVALSKSIDLLNAKFLWAKDLASPDSVSIPFTLPLIGNSVHVLPLIMVVAMVIQMRISMASMPQADPMMAQQQKMMMTIMPVFFGFIFYPMPSGLVIYWLTNTVVTTAYQKFLRNQAVRSATPRIA